MKPPDIDHLVATIQADTARLAPNGPWPGVAATHARLDEWAGLGYPTGGGNPSRGGDATPLPERLALAGAIDTHAEDLLELEVSLKVAADCLATIGRLVARHTPTKRNPEDRPTATCLDCGRTIADNAIDPIKAGRCTYSKAEPLIGCYGLREARRKAEYRARQRAEEAEGVEGVPSGQWAGA